MLVNLAIVGFCSGRRINMRVSGWNCNCDGVWMRFDQSVNVFDVFSQVTGKFDHWRWLQMHLWWLWEDLLVNEMFTTLDKCFA